MDSRSRTLVREAQARDGDPVAEALVLADRLRRGDLARDRLEVAEVCGSEAARLALGTEATYSPVGFTVLVDGLPDVALLPALIAAAEATLPHVDMTQEARAAAACVLEAARAFSVAPSEAPALAWRLSEKRWQTLGSVVPQGWLPLAWVCLADDPRDQVAGKRRRLVRCHLLVGDVVQSAVRRALIAWALA